MSANVLLQDEILSVQAMITMKAETDCCLPLDEANVQGQDGRRNSEKYFQKRRGCFALELLNQTRNSVLLLVAETQCSMLRWRRFCAV